MRRARTHAAIAAGAAGWIAACGGHGGHGDHGDLPPPPPMIHPEPWDGTLTLPTFADTSPAPDVVEVSVGVRAGEVAYLPGARSPAWTYDGLVPGPVLVARRGDRVVVHVENQLAEPTTIHWHGVRVSNAMDGTARVMDPIPPGGTYRYELVMLDAGTSGTTLTSAPTSRSRRASTARSSSSTTRRRSSRPWPTRSSCSTTS